MIFHFNWLALLPLIHLLKMRQNNSIGIVELIDRTLNKGVILIADLIVTVADVPLLAANLRLALASVETMLKYGMMSDWLTAVSLDKEESKAIETIEKQMVTNF